MLERLKRLWHAYQVSKEWEFATAVLEHPVTCLELVSTQAPIDVAVRRALAQKLAEQLLAIDVGTIERCSHTHNGTDRVYRFTLPLARRIKR